MKNHTSTDLPSSVRAERLLDLCDQLDMLPPPARIVKFRGLTVHVERTLVWSVWLGSFIVGAFLGWPLLKLVILNGSLGWFGIVRQVTKRSVGELRTERERERMLEEIRLIESDT